MNQNDNPSVAANTPAANTPKAKGAAGNRAADVTTGGGDDADPAARKARLKQVDEHLDAIKKIEQIDDGQVCVPDAKTVQSMNTKYGKDLQDCGLAMAEAVEGCTEAFAGTEITASSVRGKEGRVRELTSTLEKLDETRVFVAGKLREAQVDLYVVTDKGGQVIKATLQNPATGKTLRDDLTSSSRKFRGLTSDRSAAIAALRDGKKTAKGAVLADLTDTDVSLQETQADLAKAQLQIKYMQGENLRPDDVIEVAKATAPHGSHAKTATGPASSGATPAKPRAPRAPRGKGKGKAAAPGTPAAPGRATRRTGRRGPTLH